MKPRKDWDNRRDLRDSAEQRRNGRLIGSSPVRSALSKKLIQSVETGNEALFCAAVAAGCSPAQKWAAKSFARAGELCFADGSACSEAFRTRFLKAFPFECRHNFSFQSELVRAVERKDAERAHLLLTFSCDPGGPAADGRKTLLGRALDNDDERTAKVLLACGAPHFLTVGEKGEPQSGRGSSFNWMFIDDGFGIPYFGRARPSLHEALEKPLTHRALAVGNRFSRRIFDWALKFEDAFRQDDGSTILRRIFHAHGLTDPAGWLSAALAAGADPDERDRGGFLPEQGVSLSFFGMPTVIRDDSEKIEMKRLLALARAEKEAAQIDAAVSDARPSSKISAL